MNHDLFRISQQQGIYHTLSLWSLLSPNLARSEKTAQSANNNKTPQSSRKSGKKTA
jgi:hypothetical protein